MRAKIGLSTRGNFVSSKRRLLSQRAVQKDFLSFFDKTKKHHIKDVIEATALSRIQAFASERISMDLTDPQQVEVIVRELFVLAYRQVLQDMLKEINSPHSM
ncbi:MAG TPA: hypothetical protein VNS58_24550 [Puia sp.]|nr:hypothetical protein [Puia sp.]